MLSAHPLPLPGSILTPTEQNRRFSRHRFFPQLIVQKTLSFPPLICMCTKIGNLDFPRYIFHFFRNFPFFKKNICSSLEENLFLIPLLYIHLFVLRQTLTTLPRFALNCWTQAISLLSSLMFHRTNYLLFKKKR